MTAIYRKKTDDWLIKGTLGSADFEVRLGKKVKKKTGKVTRTFGMYWDKFTVFMKSDHKEGPGACTGEIRYGSTRTGEIFCESSGTYTDLFFTNPDHVVAWLIQTYVWGKDDRVMKALKTPM